MGMSQKIFSYYINDEVTIKALNDDKMMIGNMGAEIYTLSIPTKRIRNLSPSSIKTKDTIRLGYAVRLL